MPVRQREKVQKMLRRLTMPKEFLICALSGALTAAAFAPLEWAVFAWLGLAPLIASSLRAQKPSDAAQLGFAWGLGFWLFAICWLRRVAVPGWLALSVYCAAYPAAFAAMTRLFAKTLTPRNCAGGATAAIAVSAIWTALEYLRSTLGTGFPWNQLGVSQYRRLALIQCAEYGGVYAVSFLLAMANTALALIVIAVTSRETRPGAAAASALAAAAAAICLVFGKGAAEKFKTASTPTVIAAVQPNIPQFQKWSEEFRDFIYSRLKSGTLAALETGEPELIVWPETALPDFMRSDSPSMAFLKELLARGTPILLGAMDYSEQSGEREFFNSSFLFLTAADAPVSHAKLHLVLFGEYVPMAKTFPFLRRLTPIEENFSPGAHYTVFALPASGEDERSEIRFSVLICFEDTVPELARAFVRNGARLLINQTNDAWFDPSAGSRQHMSHCVFRCVENRTPAVRAANTGISCAIAQNGAILAETQPAPRGPPRAPEHLLCRITVPADEMPLTFYTRHGDVFALSCAAVACAAAAPALLLRRKMAAQ